MAWSKSFISSLFSFLLGGKEMATYVVFIAIFVLIGYWLKVSYVGVFVCKLTMYRLEMWCSNVFYRVFSSFLRSFCSHSGGVLHPDP